MKKCHQTQKHFRISQELCKRKKEGKKNITQLQIRTSAHKINKTELNPCNPHSE